MGRGTNAREREVRAKGSVGWAEPEWTERAIHAGSECFQALLRIVCAEPQDPRPARGKPTEAREADLARRDRAQRGQRGDDPGHGARSDVAEVRQSDVDA